MVRASRLVPAPRLPVLMAEERALLARLVAAGGAVGSALAQQPQGPSDRAARLLFRRWVLEAVVVLRAAPGPLRANRLAEALRIRGQVFANKARELVALGVVERREISRQPPKVEYALTPLGRDLGSFALALAAFKALQCEASRADADRALAAPTGVRLEVSGDLERLLAGACGDADRLATLYLESRGAEAAVPELRRYAETCVRRWHAPVLIALTAGPLRFRALGAATGAGDEALSRALRSLVALGAVATVEEAYAITPWGWGDVSLGALLVGALVARPLHAV